MPAKAVIFDMDGVIIDSEGIHSGVWQSIFNEAGIRISEEDYHHAVGRQGSDFLNKIFEKNGLDFSLDDWLVRKQHVYRERLSQEVNIFPGVEKLIISLSGKLDLAIASGDWRQNIEIVLDKFRLRSYFRVLLGKENVKGHKPAPEVYLLACDRLGISPAEGVAIEDSTVGIAAARAAGLRCIAVTNGFSSSPKVREAERKQADLSVDSLENTDLIERFILNL
jgi:HAD superfamily hydrolase (TIGR01509 family)